MLRRTLVVLALAACSFGWNASSARAQAVPDAARAGQLFDEARGFMERQEFGPACAKLRESQRLDPQLGTLLHLAHCYEKQGQLANAYRTFQAAAELAAVRNARGLSEPREKLARERAASLEPRLSLLELHLRDAPPELRLTLDDVLIDRVQWNRPLAIEAGEHRLHASAPGRQAWQQAFTIGAPGRLGIAVPALAPQPGAAPTLAAEPRVPLTGPSPTAASSGVSVQRTAGYITIGAGVVGLGLGTAFGLMRNGKVSDLEEHCDLDAGRCTIARGDTIARKDIQATRDDAAGFAAAANVAWVLGGVAIAGGLVLVLTAPRPEREGVSIHVAPGAIRFTARTNAF